jgi:hypothetical protein
MPAGLPNLKIFSEKKNIYIFKKFKFFFLYFSWSISSPAGPLDLKCIKKKIWKKIKIFFYFFIFLFFIFSQDFLEAFQVWRARRHSVIADTMPAGLPYLKCIKNNFGEKIFIYLFIYLFIFVILNFSWYILSTAGPQA